MDNCPFYSPVLRRPWQLGVTRQRSAALLPQNLPLTPQPPCLGVPWVTNLFTNLVRNSRAFKTTKARVRQKQGELATNTQGKLRDKVHSPPVLTTTMETKLRTNTNDFTNLKKRTGPTLNPDKNYRATRLRQLPKKWPNLLNPAPLNPCVRRRIIPLVTPGKFVPPVRQGTQWRTLLHILTPPMIL